MKKVGLLISEMNKGGAERVVSRLTQILSDDYIVYLILFEDTFMEYDYAGTLINLDVKSVSGMLDKIVLLLKRINSLKEVKKQYDLDIVISFLDSPNIVNILSKTKGCKVGVSIRNYSLHENRLSLIAKLTNFCIKTLYNKADVVIPVTKVIANSYIKEYGIHKDRMQVIYNPYDVAHIQQLASVNLDNEHKEFITKGKTIISVGRHMYQKGFWHLVKAFKLVHDQHEDAKLIIVGRDCDNGKVQKLVDELGLHKHVLLTGQQDNPFKFISNSDIYVLSSLFEGFPNSLVEGMACGCPVIAVDCKSGPREILYENPNLNIACDGIEYCDFGILTAPMDMVENWNPEYFTASEVYLSKAIIQVIENETLRNYYSGKSLERAIEFSSDKCKVDYVKVIENSINNRS